MVATAGQDPIGEKEGGNALTLAFLEFLPSLPPLSPTGTLSLTNLVLLDSLGPKAIH